MSRPARPTEARLEPVVRPSAEQQEVLDRASGRPGSRPLNIFSTMVANRRVANRAVLLGAAFLNKGSLSGRDREIVILRVAHRTGSEYEYGQHVLIGRREGLADAEIAALGRDDPGAGWSAREQALVQLVDELCAHDCVGDATWSVLATEWSDEQLVELVMLAGYYRMIAGFLNSAGVQLDEGVPGWFAEQGE